MRFSFPPLEAKDWLLILATIAGPILAVQAHKWVERLREGRNRKLRLFERLMATRAARLSAEHVQALNMIDLVFYGSCFFDIHRRSKTEQASGASARATCCAAARIAAARYLGGGLLLDIDAVRASAASSCRPCMRARSRATPSPDAAVSKSSRQNLTRAGQRGFNHSG
jgi:hypothetical protein